MANMASKVRFPVDGLSFLQLESDAVLATGAGAIPSTQVISLDALASYWDAGELAFNQQVAIAVDVTTAVTGGGETYTYAIQTDSELAFGDAPVIITQVTHNAVGEFALAFTREMVLELDPDATHVRLLVTQVGAAAAATYNARIVPFPGN